MTFIVVASSRTRGGGHKATQRKLNAIASALAELIKNADADQEHVVSLRRPSAWRSGRARPAEPADSSAPSVLALGFGAQGTRGASRSLR